MAVGKAAEPEGRSGAVELFLEMYLRFGFQWTEKIQVFDYLPFFHFILDKSLPPAFSSGAYFAQK